jgi:hypothetical protein
LALATTGSACEPEVVVGARLCPQFLDETDAAPKLDAAATMPWHTGFEDGFCEYAQPTGFCYGFGVNSYTVVTSPVHSGRYAAAFSARGDVDGGSQVRCVQQGVFPAAAYYGAWYYVPEAAQNSGVWNLFHFQGGVPNQTHGLWDVSLANLADGGLHLTLFDFLTGIAPDAGALPPIPVGRWFHIEVYFKRANDTTGELSMWQDSVEAVHLTGLKTDDTGWGQWYVGNFVTALLPPASTLYVDDVTIAPAL